MSCRNKQVQRTHWTREKSASTFSENSHSDFESGGFMKLESSFKLRTMAQRRHVAARVNSHLALTSAGRSCAGDALRYRLPGSSKPFYRNGGESGQSYCNRDWRVPIRTWRTGREEGFGRRRCRYWNRGPRDECSDMALGLNARRRVVIRETSGEAQIHGWHRQSPSQPSLQELA